MAGEEEKDANLVPSTIRRDFWFLWHRGKELLTRCFYSCGDCRLVGLGRLNSLTMHLGISESDQSVHPDLAKQGDLFESAPACLSYRIGFGLDWFRLVTGVSQMVLAVFRARLHHELQGIHVFQSCFLRQRMNFQGAPFSSILQRLFLQQGEL